MIFEAIKLGDYNKVVELIEQGEDINQLSSTAWTPILEAAYQGQYSIVEYLIKKGANFNYTHPSNHYTSLTISQKYGFLKIANLLKSHGAKCSLLSDFEIKKRQEELTNKIAEARQSQVIDASQNKMSEKDFLASDLEIKKRQEELIDKMQEAQAYQIEKEILCQIGDIAKRHSISFADAFSLLIIKQQVQMEQKLKLLLGISC